eukprot:TRINITY_DN12661_c0_g4_i2.p1 TRINITY_DN12661_c0_g4~~TRINITY_DN12661_c0_g4_i2.p1  ORF type:complete len:210 (+),score=7.72 TRINITY_DN12661_c0_g4_i2:59-688(+)
MAGTATDFTSSQYILHVQNIPCKVLEADFRTTMRKVGLDVSRYHLYFPKRTRRSGRSNNYGYGFVHCGGAGDAEAFTQRMQGFRFEDIGSNKRLAIRTANRSSAAFPMGFDSTVDQLGASYAVDAWTQHVESWGSSTSSSTSSSPVAYLSANTSLAEHSATLPTASMGAPESLISSGVRPDVSEVPPTRLAGPTYPLANESAHMAFRFQ